MKQIKLSQLDDYVTCMVDEDSKKIKLTFNEGYKVMTEIMGDYSLSVNGDVMANYNGKIFIGSFPNGETIGMDIDMVRSECQRQYEETMQRFAEEMAVPHAPYNEFSLEEMSECSIRT